jgi:P27 family predicted phage terminase small subunit
MGLRGPQKAPAKVLQLKGRAPGKDIAGRAIAEAPKFIRSAPEPPAWLSELARQQWDLCAPTLESLDLFKPEDQAAFTVFCEAWATYVEAIKLVRADGVTVFNPKTQHAHKNPALAAAESASADLLRFAREFGLTPAAEQMVGKTKADDGNQDDPFGQEVG